MLSLGGLPEVVGPGGHRRSKSDCGLDKRDEVADLATLNPNYRSTSPSGHLRAHGHAHTRPNTPIMARSPSTSSIPEIFISSEDDNGPGVSPITRLAVFSLADFLETVTHAQHHPRKKCSSSEVGGPGHGGGRRRSPLAARKSTPAAGGASAGEVTAANNTTNNSTPGGGALGGVGGQTTLHQPRTGGGAAASRLGNPTGHHDDAPAHSSNEDCDAETVPSSGVSNGSGELVDALRVGGGDIGTVDDGEEHTPHIQRTREALEHIQAKIQKTKDLIKEEQKARDENVNEYLKLAANADRQQMARIKAVFEKKNQKSAALIQQLQKKLENYQKRLREIETHGLIVAHRQPKEVLRDMGQGLKTVISKPKEIAHLIKNKFGSADNIKELAGEEERDEERVHHGSATLPVGASLVPPTSSNQGSNLPSHHQGSSAQGAGGSSSGGGHHGSKIGSEEGSECNSSITSESVPGGSTTLAHLASPRNHHSQLTSVDFYGLPGGTTIEQLLMELRESREESTRLREEIDTIKQTLAAEVNSMRDGLAEERFRCDRLEEQINDLTELHQNEMGNLVTNMSDMEEKVQYQSEERIRDLHEIVENCHTRISRMEHQQAQQQQQYLTLEGLENSNARAVFVKLINVLLTVLQVLLLVVATVANILTPLLQTRTRLVVTASIVFFLVFVYIQLPELKEMWFAIVDRYLKFFTTK
ncbi:transmembrane and coiled-coil domains protein 1 isoform X2 [Procambarus clarkii]|uniref:transmembrane and coiled-coil domains protein 1 isoform X2 n=1 Tax=Procambarus clarkii TaxID=6728 RepID=UPI001E6728D6|nr:transmembrane and coiled-coil domains protein 1-like isoform X2 [Procambarus clarkii]